MLHLLYRNQKRELLENLINLFNYPVCVKLNHNLSILDLFDEPFTAFSCEVLSFLEQLFIRVDLIPKAIVQNDCSIK